MREVGRNCLHDLLAGLVSDVTGCFLLPRSLSALEGVAELVKMQCSRIASRYVLVLISS